MTTGGEEGAGLQVGGGDPSLDGRLSRELDAYNVAASGLDDQREFTVKVETTADWWPV